MRRTAALFVCLALPLLAGDVPLAGMVTRDYADRERMNWAGTVAPGAAISRRAAKYPLIVMSHGTGGSSVMLMWLGLHLAAL